MYPSCEQALIASRRQQTKKRTQHDSGWYRRIKLPGGLSLFQKSSDTRGKVFPHIVHTGPLFLEEAPQVGVIVHRREQLSTFAKQPTIQKVKHSRQFCTSCEI